MLFKRRPTSEPRPEPPPEAARWREAHAARERAREREEAERLHALDETFQAHVKNIGFYFPGDGAPYAPLAASARRPHGLGGRISDAMRALFGDPR